LQSQTDHWAAKNNCKEVVGKRFIVLLVGNKGSVGRHERVDSSDTGIVRVGVNATFDGEIGQANKVGLLRRFPGTPIYVKQGTS
jgi:hypothetical protein